MSNGFFGMVGMFFAFIAILVSVVIMRNDVVEVQNKIKNIEEIFDDKSE